MNKHLQPIFSRRSVRDYQARPVDETTIQDLLDAGMAAPSACGKDPWEFIVLRDPQKLRDIAEALPNGGFLADAGAGLVVCGDLRRAHANELSYLLQDCSAAIENILLASSILGLGACWLGVHPRTERVDFLKRYFSLPESIVPVATLALGWPKKNPEPRTRSKADFVHYEEW